MSYLRYNSPYKYLFGKSNDYVFSTYHFSKEVIEDYGKMSNESIIEILLNIGVNSKDILLVHLAKRLAENLEIELRKKPLTTKQLIEESFKISKEVEKEVQGLGVKRNGWREMWL